MIHLLEPGAEAKLLEALREDPVIGVRLHGIHQIYGPSADLWIQEVRGLPTAALIASAEGRWQLAASPRADTDELGAFLLSHRPRSVFLNAGFCGKMKGFAIVRTAPFMLYHGPLFGERNPAILDVPSLSEVYELLAEADVRFLERSPRDVWYTATSHLVRHRLGSVCGIALQGKLASTASISAIGERHALIDGVATRRGLRGQGFAASLVRHLVDRALEMGRIPCLYCAEESLAGYYAALGFAVAGYWAEIASAAAERDR